MNTIKVFDKPVTINGIEYIYSLRPGWEIIVIRKGKFKCKEYDINEAIELSIRTTDKKYCGSLTVYLKTHIIEAVGVDLYYRRRGIAQYLLQRAIEDYGASNISVFRDNSIALNLYHKMGFKIIDYNLMLGSDPSYGMKLSK